MAWIKRILPALLFFAPVLSLAAPFYRHIDANFISGQATVDELEKNLLRVEFKPNYHIIWDKKKYVVKGDELIFDKQLAKTLYSLKNALLRSEPKSNSSFIKGLDPKTKLEVLNTDSYWAEVNVPSLHLRGWIPLVQTEIPNDDLGVFVPLVDTFLRERPQQNSPIVTTIPSNYRLTPITYNKNWILVSYLGKQGYVDLHHGVHRADFARWGYSSKRRSWIPISRREDGDVIALDQSATSLSEFIAFSADHDKAVIIRSQDSDGPQKFSNVEITQRDSDLWAVSHIEGHGQVWWKKQTLLSETKDENEISITTEQLLKRKIFSMALTDEKQVHGLISAEGVFRTTDGKTWIKIKQFGNKDVPVAIHSNGDWLVGDFRSQDKGKTFEPYIRWDWVAQSIESNFGRTPKYLKLQKIKTLDQSKVEISVDTGYHQVHLRSSTNGTTFWKMVE